MLRALFVAGVVAGSSIAVVPAANAYETAPTAGITAVRTGEQLKIQLTPEAMKALKADPGFEIAAVCTQADTVPALALTDAGDEGAAAQAAAGTIQADRTATLKLSFFNARRAVDSCTIFTRSEAHPTAIRTATVALTPQGIVTLDEGAAATAMRKVLDGARTAAGSYEPAARVKGAVALASADATAPPAGQVGYFAQGATAIVKATSLTGRPLFVQITGDVVRTDLPAQLSLLMTLAFTSGATSGAASGSGSSSGDFDASVARAGAAPRAVAASDGDRTKSPYKRDEPQTALSGVRVARHGKRVTFRFAGRSAFAFKALRGRRVTVLCATAPKAKYPPFPVDDFDAIEGSASHVVVRVPRHGGAVTATLEHTRDFCVLSDDGNEVAVGGVTAAGRRFTDDFATVLAFEDVTDAVKAAAPGATAYWPAAKVVAQDRAHLVALSGPEAKGPAGKVGYWSDGAGHAAFSATSGSGHRYLYEDEGGGVIRTNLISATLPALEVLILGL